MKVHMSSFRCVFYLIRKMFSKQERTVYFIYIFACFHSAY